MRFGPYPVKHSHSSTKTAPEWSGWLEGWGLLFPSVGVALLAGWLALPQGTMPDYLPLPVLSQAEVDRAKREWSSAADAARREPLDYDVRAVGEAFRMLGRLAHGTESITIEQRRHFREAVAKVRSRFGSLPLAKLRAVQGKLFLGAIAQLEQTGIETEELIELGGDFVRIARELGWLAEANPPGSIAERCPLMLSQDERLALFMVRWNDLAGIGEDPELRLASIWPLITLRARLRLPIAQLGQRELGVIERVKTLDPNYPAHLSAGLLHIRLGNRERAIEALQTYLHAHNDGPYQLRARNHLLFAVEHMQGNGS